MSSLDVAYEKAQLIDQLRELADPVRAVNEKKYLKSDLNFHGLTVPKLNSLMKSWCKAHADLSIEEIAALAEALWASDWHEERSLAVFLLVESADRLTLDQLPLVERMIHEVNTWAHLDEIAVHVVGALLAHDPDVLRPYLFKWAEDPNFWVRRTAILSQNAHFRRNKCDFELFEQITSPMLDESKAWSPDERFFIRKAIGWALRELAPRQPELVVGYVQRHRERMSGLTFREATRKLPDEWRQRLD
ncbi:MAG: DNA alkylation repair protein [Anaerolineae bacterium]|nr:DNA alkylation repair protein [Anaerolineae bacterium]